MKVSENLGKSSNVLGTAGKDDRRVSDIKEAAFHGQLKRVESQNQEEKIRQLASKIVEQGQKLGKKVDIRELKIYKNLISEFLDEAMNSSLKFSKESFLDRRGRYKVYASVKKINTELEQLTEDVLKEEKDHIRILQRLDDIRGLILDLTM
ncbi:MAG: YaaR family protein [Clostridia bacterium]|nr:YaaR family protein [Clostridia bacterium]